MQGHTHASLHFSGSSVFRHAAANRGGGRSAWDHLPHSVPVNNKVYIEQCKRKTRRHKQSMEPKRRCANGGSSTARVTAGALVCTAILKYRPENFTQKFSSILQMNSSTNTKSSSLRLYQSTTRKFGYNRATGGNYSGFTMPEVRNKQKLPDSNWHKAQKNPDVSAQQKALASGKKTLTSRRDERQM